MKHAGGERPRGDGGKEAGKRPYATPRLTAHGDVEEITKVLRLATTRRTSLSGGDASQSSDRAAKENFASVDARGVLALLATIPIETWSYRGEDPSCRHMGPMAQDFARAFGLGADDKRIHTVDALGVALASIQALHGMVVDREAEIEALRSRVEELRAEVSDLKRELAPF